MSRRLCEDAVYGAIKSTITVHLFLSLVSTLTTIFWSLKARRSVNKNLAALWLILVYEFSKAKGTNVWLSSQACLSYDIINSIKNGKSLYDGDIPSQMSLRYSMNQITNYCVNQTALNLSAKSLKTHVSESSLVLSIWRVS